MDNIINFTSENPMRPLTGRVTLPSDYKEGEQLPMIVFLHGAGEVGDGTEKTIEKVCVHGIPKYFSKNPDFGGLRVITASPQCVDGFIWDHLTLFLMDWIEQVAKKYNADRSRIAITGLSMGGFGTWNMISTYPDYFCCAAPICGGGVSWRIKEQMKDFPIWTFHSIDDGAVPYEHSVIMVKKASAVGADIRFTTYTDKGHGCWDSAYEETDLIKWLASEHKR